MDRHFPFRVQVGPGPYQTDLAQLATLDVLHGIRKVGGAPLLGPHLDHPIVLAGGVDHDPTLVDGQCKWLLHIHVLARLAGHDGRDGMPVIGSGYDNRIQIGPIQEPTKILCLLLGLLFDRIEGFGLCLLHLRCIHIREGDALDSVDLQKLFQVARPLASAADQTDSNSIIGSQDAG